MVSAFARVRPSLTRCLGLAIAVVQALMKPRRLLMRVVLAVAGCTSPAPANAGVGGDLHPTISSVQAPDFEQAQR